MLGHLMAETRLDTIQAFQQILEASIMFGTKLGKANNKSGGGELSISIRGLHANVIMRGLHSISMPHKTRLGAIALASDLLESYAAQEFLGMLMDPKHALLNSRSFVVFSCCCSR
jgi:hypothetical protein